MPRLRSRVRDSSAAPVFIRESQAFLVVVDAMISVRRDSKAVMHRIANPCRSVRLRLAPPGFAAVAQLVERNLAKVEVESSRLFCRSKQKGKAKTLSLFCIRPGGEIGRHKRLKISRLMAVRVRFPSRAPNILDGAWVASNLFNKDLDTFERTS